MLSGQPIRCSIFNLNFVEASDLLVTRQHFCLPGNSRSRNIIVSFWVRAASSHRGISFSLNHSLAVGRHYISLDQSSGN
jgi:hypothetical protein